MSPSKKTDGERIADRVFSGRYQSRGMAFPSELAVEIDRLIRKYGYHGTPQRRIVMSPAQVLDYQKRVFAANEKGSLGAWLEVGKWYLQWRDAVSVPV